MENLFYASFVLIFWWHNQFDIFFSEFLLLLVEKNVLYSISYAHCIYFDFPCLGHCALMICDKGPFINYIRRQARVEEGFQMTT